MTDPTRRRFAACTAGLVLVAVLPDARAAEPLLFHDHGHGLAFSPDGTALLVPTHNGLAAYAEGEWWEAHGPPAGFSAFAVTERAIYASAHAGRGARAGRPFGLARSSDGGRTWRVLALAGEADLYLLAAGYRSGMLYVFNDTPNSAMEERGLYATADEGRTWRRAMASGMVGEIHGLAAHPSRPGTVAVASARGLYVSRDGAEAFATFDGTGPVTAVAFDLGGERLRYARALSNEIRQIGLDGRPRKALWLAPWPGDYVTCLAQNPVDGRVLAFATRGRDIYLSGDGGSNWQRVAAAGAPRDASAERQDR